MPLNIYNEQLVDEETAQDFGTSSISLPKKQHYYIFSLFFVPCLATLAKMCKFHKRSFVISSGDYYLNTLIFLSSFTETVGIFVLSCFLSPHTHTHTNYLTVRQVSVQQSS